MKLFTFLFLMLFFKNAQAVGWEEVSPLEMKSKGISIESEYQKFRDCNSFKITLPVNLFFKDLGDREFYSARYVGLQDETVTFPLSGTIVGLRSEIIEGKVALKGVCVSSKDLERAYISASYLGEQGTVPMVIYFKLKID